MKIYNIELSKDILKKSDKNIKKELNDKINVSLSDFKYGDFDSLKYINKNDFIIFKNNKK